MAEYSNVLLMADFLTVTLRYRTDLTEVTDCVHRISGARAPVWR